MNPGDVVVSGISECVPVIDIGYNVPHKVAITIPGNKAYASKDLWVCVGQGRIFVHTRLPSKPDPVVSEPEPVVESKPVPEPVVAQDSQTDLQTELARIQAESTNTRLDFEAKLGKLQAENARLRNENAKPDTGTDKLDTIIGLIEKLPIQTVQVVTKSPTEIQGGVVDDSAPVFIPSKVMGDQSNRGRLSLKESQSDGASVASASKALSKVRKKGG